jgi:hypothetical protein
MKLVLGLLAFLLVHQGVEGKDDAPEESFFSPVLVQRDWALNQLQTVSPQTMDEARAYWNNKFSEWFGALASFFKGAKTEIDEAGAITEGKKLILTEELAQQIVFEREPSEEDLAEKESVADTEEVGVPADQELAAPATESVDEDPESLKS